MTHTGSTGPLSVDSISGWYNSLKSANHCYIAYSGGLDSHVLLHLVSQLLTPEKITALHVNHQLSPNSNDWVEHCRKTSAELFIPFIAETVSVMVGGEGIEAAARIQRYACFKKHLKKDDLLLQAHHADDQVETVLYRLIRGSGVKGLAGIPQRRPLGEGELLRPLLDFSRAQIQAYAQQHELQWIEDESNLNEQFDRNFLRQSIIPLISERWPDYRQRITLSASMVSRSAEFDDKLAQEDLSRISSRQERTGWSIPIDDLLDLPLQRQGNLIRYWVASHNFPVPGHKILDTLFTEFLTAKEDASPLLTWPGAEFRRYNNRLYLMPQLRQFKMPATSSVILPGEALILPDGAKLQTTQVESRGLRITPDMSIEVRFRQGGERCQPAERGKSNTLKKLFQEYQLEPWLRDRMPLIYINEQLAAVGDLWICEGFIAADSEPGIGIQVCYN